MKSRALMLHASIGLFCFFGVACSRDVEPLSKESSDHVGYMVQPAQAPQSTIVAKREYKTADGAGIFVRATVMRSDGVFVCITRMGDVSGRTLTMSNEITIGKCD